MDFLTVYRRHFCPTTSNYQPNTRKIKTNDSLEEDGELEFETQYHVIDEHPDSPPLWTSKASAYGGSSSTRRLQETADSRRALMEMILNVPQSEYELSLRDIVEAQHCICTENVEKEDIEVSSQVQIVWKNKTVKQGQVSRHQSTDSGVFLLKMFYPVSLASKNKTKTRNCHVASQVPSFHGVDNCNCISRRISNISGGTYRMLRSYISTGWTYSNVPKCIPRRRRGCLF